VISDEEFKENLLGKRESFRLEFLEYCRGVKGILREVDGGGWRVELDRKKNLVKKDIRLYYGGLKERICVLEKNAVDEIESKMAGICAEFGRGCVGEVLELAHDRKSNFEDAKIVLMMEIGNSISLDKKIGLWRNKLVKDRSDIETVYQK
jgi:hypothetical protein